MWQRTANDGLKTPIDLLMRAESRLLKLAGNIADEAHVAELADTLRDLAAVRLGIELPRSSDKRSSARIHERSVVCVECDAGKKFEAGLHDVSAGGALIECDNPIADGETCTLHIPGLEHSVKAIVQSTQRGLTHLAFDGIQMPEIVSLLKHIERHFMRY